jgi:phage antirepressor YoqD-like protein
MYWLILQAIKLQTTKKPKSATKQLDGFNQKMSEVIMHKIMNVSNSQMMSSKEIAQLTGKEHKQVLRDIRVLLEQIGGTNLYPEQYQVVTLPNGMTGEIRLDQELSIVLGTGYSVQHRLSLVRRWKELEQQVAQPQFAIPTSLSGALMLAAQQAEQIEKQQAVIAQQAPAVAFVERFVEADGLHNVRQTAKALEMPEKEFVSRCIAAKILYRTNKALTGYQQWKDAGYLTHKEDEINGKARLQVMFTPKGIAWLGKRLIKAEAPKEAAIVVNDPREAMFRALGIRS